MFSDAVALTLQHKLADCQVIGFSKASELAHYFAQNNRADLLIVDVNLAGHCGLDLVRQYCDSPLVEAIIVCSGETNYMLPEQCQSLGADGFWGKSGSVEDFLLMVQQVLASGRKGYLQPRDGEQLNISKRQLAVLQLLVEGLSYKEIGETLFISANTVKTHVRLLYQQLDVKNRTDCITKAKALGFLH